MMARADLRLVRRLSSALGLTDGQAYTLAIGIILALVTAMIGIPPTLRQARLHGTSAVPSSVAAAPTPARPAPSSAVPVAAVPMAETPPSAAAPSHVAAPYVAAPVIDVARAEDTGSPAASYADGGKLGEVEPLATVAAPGAPSGIAVELGTGAFFVATDNAGPGPSRVQHYGADGTPLGSWTVDGQPASHARGLTGLALDGAGGLFALDASTSRVLRFDLASGEQQVAATVPDIPACTTDRAANCEPSVRDNAPVLDGATMGGGGDLYIADGGQGSVWKVDRFGGIRLWATSIDFVAPQGAGPAGLHFDGDGSLVLAVTTSAVALTGAVYRIPVGADGSAGAVQELFRSQPGNAPTGIAVGAGHRIYVTLTGSNQVLVLDKGGKTVATVASTRFDKPVGLAFRGTSLLVTNQAAATVVRASAGERGLN